MLKKMKNKNDTVLGLLEIRSGIQKRQKWRTKSPESLSRRVFLKQKTNNVWGRQE